MRPMNVSIINAFPRLQVYSQVKVISCSKKTVSIL